MSEFEEWRDHDFDALMDGVCDHDLTLIKDLADYDHKVRILESLLSEVAKDKPAIERYKHVLEDEIESISVSFGAASNALYQQYGAAGASPLLLNLYMAEESRRIDHLSGMLGSNSFQLTDREVIGSAINEFFEQDDHDQNITQFFEAVYGSCIANDLSMFATEIERCRSESEQEWQSSFRGRLAALGSGVLKMESRVFFASAAGSAIGVLIMRHFSEK